MGARQRGKPKNLKSKAGARRRVTIQKRAGKKYRSPWRAGEAGSRGHKKQKPGREPGLPLNVTL
jgi:hypothetical protein